MNKISVFGATGFIGGRFCEMYPEDVIPIPRVQANPNSDNILYLISTTHNYNRLSEDVNTNLNVLSQTLQQLDKSHTFNFISSWFIYGDDVKLPAKESYMTEFVTGNYSMTKRLAEVLIIAYCKRENIPHRIFRLANVFGKGDKFSKQKNALQYLIEEMKQNRDIELKCGGEFYRDYIHVDEVCRMLHEGMEKLPVNDIYNVGSGQRFLFKDLILLAHKVLDSKSVINFLPPKRELTDPFLRKPGEFFIEFPVRDFYMDVSKLNSYGIKMQGSVYEQLVRMILDEMEN